EGEAYTNVKTYGSTVVTPLAKGFILLADAAKTDTQLLPDRYRSDVGSEDLDEDTLTAQISAYQSTIDANNTTLGKMEADDPNKSSVQSAVNDDTAEKGKLEEKLRKLREYDAASSGFFDDIADLETNINTGLSQLQTDVAAFNGSFTIPSKKALNWTKAINTKWEKRTLVMNYVNTYGFDIETAKQIIQVKQGIDKKFPDMSQEEKDYLLLLLLGQTTTEYDNFLWHNTAGNFRDYFNNVSDVEDAYKELGLTDEETKKLVYNLRIQHEVTSGAYDDYEHLSSEQRKNFKKSAEEAYGITMTDTEFQEFWNEKYSSFRAKGNDEETSKGVPGPGNNADFTHQSMTMATHLKPDFALAHLLGGKDNAEDLAGWEGDTTTNAEKTPSIGNDDYKSDLDSVNIVERMKKNNQSYLEASNDYYHELESGKTNRADEFTNHQSLDEVKDTIFRSLVPQKVYQIAPDVWGTKDRTEEESMTYLKENYPESYNFIKSLEQSKGDLNE
ncbi:hypothetical protein AB3329_11545, partial [Streptococcus sp. H31]|uniref:hypothetical protein n=1 Tax=Streptococcus huangxiaojuni TaxID=3237239 RepID=UPI0034A375E5